MEVNRIILNSNNKSVTCNNKPETKTQKTIRHADAASVPVHYNPAMFSILPNLQLHNVSFKGVVLKKSDFQGSDLAVIEKYKANIQHFKSKDDLQTFAENKINELKEKDFVGRQEETII